MMSRCWQDVRGGAGRAGRNGNEQIYFPTNRVFSSNSAPIRSNILAKCLPIGLETIYLNKAQLQSLDFVVKIDITISFK